MIQKKIHPKKMELKTNFYHQKPKIGTSESDYERRLAPKDAKTYQAKKTSTFNDLNYTSRYNPLAKGQNNRLDKLYKETYQRKKKVAFISDRETDPVSLKYEPPSMRPFMKPQFRNTATLQIQLQRKYELPAARKLSSPTKKYHNQLGLSQSLQNLPRTRDPMNSSAIDPVLKYVEADHQVKQVTWKIGSRHV